MQLSGSLASRGSRPRFLAEENRGALSGLLEAVRRQLAISIGEVPNERCCGIIGLEYLQFRDGAVSAVYLVREVRGAGTVGGKSDGQAIALLVGSSRPAFLEHRIAEGSLRRHLKAEGGERFIALAADQSLHIVGKRPQARRSPAPSAHEGNANAVGAGEFEELGHAFRSRIAINDAVVRAGARLRGLHRRGGGFPNIRGLSG